MFQQLRSLRADTCISLIALGLTLGTAHGQTVENPAKEPKSGFDWRMNLVREFLKAKGSPLVDQAGLFLQVADQHSLDWRLLPSLAVVETAGLREIRNNNAFGWGNGRIRFDSVPESIMMVAERLANSASYRNKTTEDKLRTYNPRNRSYATRVIDLMSLICPVGAPTAAAALAVASDAGALK